VPSSISYTRTRSSRRYHLPFYSSAIGTIAIHFEYLPGVGCPSSYALIVSAAGLVSAIPTDVRNVPWEDWGPSSTHLFKMSSTRLISLGPFWITDYRSPPVVRQYDLQHTRYIQSIAGIKSLLQSRPPIVDSETFQYDIETHLPYREVTIKGKDPHASPASEIVANREWFVEITYPDEVRRFFVHIVGIFRCESDHSHLQGAGPFVTVYHVG